MMIWRWCCLSLLFLLLQLCSFVCRIEKWTGRRVCTKITKLVGRGFGNNHLVQLQLRPSLIRTVVRECCNDDKTNKWNSPKFYSSSRRNPDHHRNWQAWLRHVGFTRHALPLWVSAPHVRDFPSSCLSSFFCFFNKATAYPLTDFYVKDVIHAFRVLMTKLNQL